MDEETGEIEYRIHSLKDEETGEEELLTYCLNRETGEKEFISISRICDTFDVPNPFKISRYTTQPTDIIRNKHPKYRSSERRMEFITAIVFLIPTFIIFTPLLGVFILTFDVILHRWCHRQNSKLGLRCDDDMYYQSPLHMIYKEFCSKCVAEEDCKKINKIQDKRYNKKRYTMEESLRRVVA